MLRLGLISVNPVYFCRCVYVYGCLQCCGPWDTSANVESGNFDNSRVRVVDLITI